MFTSLSQFYCSKEWRELRQRLLNERRSTEDGLLYDEYDGSVIIDECNAVIHHKIYLTEQNVNDYSISLNPDNLMIVSHSNHNKIHKRFEWKKSQWQRKVYIIFGVSGSYSGGSGSIGSYVSSTPTNSGTNLTFTIDNIDSAIGFFIGHYSYMSPSGSHDLDYILSVFIPNDASTNAGTSRYVSTLSNDGRAYRLIETDDTYLGYLKLGNSLMLIANTPDMFIFSPNANYYCYPIYGS